MLNVVTDTRPIDRPSCTRLPPQEDGVAWPTAEWPVADLPDAVSLSTT